VSSESDGGVIYLRGTNHNFFRSFLEVLWFYGSMVLWFYGSMVLWFYGSFGGLFSIIGFKIFF